jgi:dihydroxy-acid dehydratase
MPEVGKYECSKKLLEQGVVDMVRISDGRMSGTGFGTVVLHVSPESAKGGTLALVQNGDWIELDVANRKLSFISRGSGNCRTEEELDTESPCCKKRYMFSSNQQHVSQAHLGVDMDFCVGGFW